MCTHVSWQKHGLCVCAHFQLAALYSSRWLGLLVRREHPWTPVVSRTLLFTYNAIVPNHSLHSDSRLRKVRRVMRRGLASGHVSVGESCDNFVPALGPRSLA